MDKRLKILIVDDTIIYRKILSDVVSSTGIASVEQAVSNGTAALEFLKRSKIDVVLLDVVMPGIDGISTLKSIKKEYPDTEVIMISGRVSNNASVTIEALELGAMDFILKPDDSDKGMGKIKYQLQMLFAQIKVKKFTVPKIRKTLRENTSLANPNVAKSNSKINRAAWPGADIILITSSTGGPSALETVFSGFKSNLKKPVLLVQHMPPEFTKILAQTLKKKFSLSVKEGSEGETVTAEQITVAPGGFHMVVNNLSNLNKVIHLEETPHVNGVRPAADVLFRSVAKHYEGKNVLVVVLTGMGCDGMNGVKELKEKCNCYCITQSEESCVVYGMPRSVYEAGLSDEVVDLKDISKRILQMA